MQSDATPTEESAHSGEHEEVFSFSPSEEEKQPSADDATENPAEDDGAPLYQERIEGTLVLEESDYGYSNSVTYDLFIAVSEYEDYSVLIEAGAMPAAGEGMAVEAALKMMLARFYSLDGSPAPYAGRIPVFLVMADQAGGLAGNYHGTTVVAQTLRGLWPEFTRKMEDAGIYRVVSVPINDAAGFRQAIETWNTPPYKTAGFCHEIIMMNYGGIRPPTASAAKATRRCCATRSSPAPGTRDCSCFGSTASRRTSSPWARVSPAASIPPAACC